MSYAILFPGQGSQQVGMGAELFDARPDLLGDVAQDVLGWSLRDVCLDGPIERLTSTDHAQPALYALAFALWSQLSARLGAPPAATAGHSLGEYTALAAAGYVSYEDGLRLVAARGAAMADAAALEPSGMAALLGVDEETAAGIAQTRRETGGRLWVANINAPGQIVVAGGKDDIEWLAENARELGARRAIPLNVAGAFHSPYMEPAVDAVAGALGTVDFASPRFPVWANVTAAPLAAGEAAKTLAQQVVSPVRFSDSLAGMAAAGIDTFIHVGPGDVTAGMAKRAAPGTTVVVVNSLAGLDEAASALEAAIQ
jgi:[acyl-carrier-protein] S-malonyltransferase